MKRVLLVIDVQNEYFTGAMPITYPEGSFRNILSAMDGAAAAGVPVLLVQHTAPQPDAKTFCRGTQGWEIHESVLCKHHDGIIEKRLPGSFTGTGLDERLRGMEVGTVAICGYMTQMCCDTTSRQAVHLGYSVEFLSDATGTLDVCNAAGSVTASELHRAILVTQQMRFAKVMATTDWLAALSK